MVIVPIAFILATIIAIYVSMGRVAGERVEESLVQGTVAYDRYAELHRSLIAVEAVSIAQTPYLHAVLGIPDVDHDTLLFTAQELHGIARTDLLLLLDTDGQILADAVLGKVSAPDMSEYEGVSRALTGLDQVAAWNLRGSLYRVALSPVVVAQQVLGVLVLGRAIDDRAAHDIEEFTGQQVLVLDSRGRAMGQSGDPVDPALAASVLSFVGNQPFTTRLGGEESLAISIPLGTTGGRVVLLQAVDSLVLPYHALRLVVLIGGLLAVGLTLAIGIKMSRDVSRPVLELRDAVMDFGGGQLESRVAIRSDDELGRLGRAFNKMADDIAIMSEELVGTREAALQASRLKSRFLANMSHEIRTPMNGVLGMNRLLLETNLAPKQRGYVETAIASAETLLTVIDDILDFSKVEAGKLELVDSEVDLAVLLRNTCLPFLLQAREKGLSLTSEVAADTPKLVRGDAGRLRQVLTNLIGNAVKFTANGGISIRVRPDTPSDSDSGIRFEVIDTGIGVPEDRRSAIFSAFEQADGSTTREFGGSGLGLCISSQLVELMGGRIGLESEAGRGSTFWFSAPLEPVTRTISSEPSTGIGAPAKVRRLQPRKSSSATRSGEGTFSARVLVVEDHDVNQEVVLAILDSHGLSAELACNGLEALEALERSAFDVVLMDCHMPEMDGFSAIAEIREREAGGERLPVIAMTALAMKGDRERCLEAGMDDYVPKPVDAGELIHKIKHFVAKGERGPNPNRIAIK